MAYLTISHLNSFIKSNLENDDRLKNLQVIGEISNLKIHYTGHWYLTLKDEKSRINAVMFSTYAKKIKFPVNDGMKVVLTGDIGVYEQGGTYQLYIHSIDPVGLGNLYLQFEELKKKLNNEGLFNPEYKVAIPKYPEKIVVISAPQGAVIHDVTTTLQRRWPLVEVILLPTLVQGKDAASDIVNSLIKADNLNVDLIILARGGGSLEDLWAFNEEIVARQIFKTKTPIISAIGHETDYTIADYVSDLRAPTPTAAAELAAPNIVTVKNDLLTIKSRLITAINNTYEIRAQKIESVSRANCFTKPELLYATKAMYIDNLRGKFILSKEKYLGNFDKRFTDYYNQLKTLTNKILTDKKTNFANYVGKLDALSPLKVLERGYSIVEKENIIIKKIKDVTIEDVVKIRLVDGKFEAKVISKEKKHGKEN